MNFILIIFTCLTEMPIQCFVLCEHSPVKRMSANKEMPICERGARSIVYSSYCKSKWSINGDSSRFACFGILEIVYGSRYIGPMF